MAEIGHDLNLLVPLRALLEEANVTAAGLRVGLGQSSMSSALARLRASFGDELLVRVGREYELTPFARQLLPQVQATIPLIERVLTDEPAPDPAMTRRTVSLMLTDHSLWRLAPALAATLQAAPRLQAELVHLPQQPMESDYDLMAHDFVVLPPGVGIEGSSLPLVDDDYVCLLDANNPALRDGALSLEDFLALPQAVAYFGRHHYTPADRRLRELGFDRRAPRVTTSSFLSLLTIVARTDLVAVVPRGLAQRLGPLTGTVGVEPPFGRVDLSLRLWWHDSHDSDPVHVWFRGRLIEELAAAP
jgi:DNA-binding transcriptional LysR family regulator